MAGQSIKSKVQKHIQELKTGIKSGLSTGYVELDEYVGRMDEGQIWAVGGYPGVGKSYFIQNMADQILSQSDDTSVVIYTAELSEGEYALRHIYMHAGVWRRSLENTPEKLPEFAQTAADYLNAYIGSGRMRIVPVGSYSEIFEDVMQNDQPSAYFVDYIQPIGMEGFEEDNIRVTELSRAFKRLALDTRRPWVIASQITNYSVKDKLGSSSLVPFDYGKELNRAAHVSIVLTRRKSNDSLANVLEARIMKAREGQLGTIHYKINPGYQLQWIDKFQAQHEYELWQ